jgi:hypothetical protein
VQRIEFSQRNPTSDANTTLIGLSNGDILPGSIESLDDNRLTVVSADAGRMEIPRTSVKSIQMGIQPRKLIYQGPNNLEEWLDGGDERKNWTFERRALIANGPADASRDLALTRQFVLRFSLVWQPGQVPNFQVYFADPLLPRTEAADRYYLQFGGAGMEIKREAAKGKRYHTIIILNRSHIQYPENRLNVEIRVNRDNARMELLLNGESEGQFADPIPSIPSGTGISLVSNTPDGSTQEIRDIVVLEDDDSRPRHLAEDRGNADSDSLISREDDRWSGKLIAARPTEDGLVFLFKTTFQDTPMEIPARDVSTVFLASSPAAKPTAENKQPFVLRLHGDGALAVTSCRFSSEGISADHPLLGPLKLRPGSISAIERAPAEP